MIKIELNFDGIAVDNIYANSNEEALDIIENHYSNFEDQNEEIKRDWLKSGGNPNPTISYTIHNYNDINKSEVNVMKKYTIEDYKEFCNKALNCPPDTADDEWYENHTIRIIVDSDVMELDYLAYTVETINSSLEEIYNEEHEIAFTDTIYRMAEVKDVVRYYISKNIEKGENLRDSIIRAKINLLAIENFNTAYQEILQCGSQIYEKYNCDFSKFNPNSFKDISAAGIKQCILNLIGSDIELSYDSSTDKTFIIDYTFNTSGEFVNWSWGQLNEKEIEEMINNYRTKLLS